MFECGYFLITSLVGVTLLPLLVKARFCEGGHRCSLPKECCPQGCCYLYAPPSAPRSPPAATDHVLNLFFINHWYFWCLLLAIILAILCACSLWKKRRQLCGWGSSDHRTQSEGDSAGSCYAPPQYSRCSSFHHPPPPYTEVTSKPDLYPLVFTCNGDNGKSGAGYLMVQYFRNYIVRPAGSLSATSTVDSLSSSFICTTNEANTLVPPPYSRAASPEASIVSQNQRHFFIPRSASQLFGVQDVIPNNNRNNTLSNINTNSNLSQNTSMPAFQLKNSESVNFQNFKSVNGTDLINTEIGSHSDQQFRYDSNRNSSLSDIFINSNSSNKERITTSKQVDAQIKKDMCYIKNSTKPLENSTKPLYSSCGSIGGVSITVPIAGERETEFRNIDVLRSSLETCCQVLQKQVPSVSYHGSPVDTDCKKFESVHSYVTSTTCSAVSSLANIASPSSPPQATSPTDEVKELLEQIRNFQEYNQTDDSELTYSNGQKPSVSFAPSKRPLTLQGKKKFFSKPNKSLYNPIGNSNIRPIRSPIGTTNFLGRGRGRRGWVSRSAPTTPGTSLPTSKFGDDSPLLNEHDEDAEQNT